MTRFKQMSAREFCAALEKLGLDEGELYHGIVQLTEAAELLNANDRTVRRWASGHSRVPPGVAIVLRLLVRGDVTRAAIERVRK